MRTFKVHTLRIGLENVRRDITGDIENALVVLYRILIVDRRVFKFIFIRIAALFQFNYTLHQRMMKMELKFRMIAIIICHYLIFLGVRRWVVRSKEISH